MEETAFQQITWSICKSVLLTKAVDDNTEYLYLFYVAAQAQG